MISIIDNTSLVLCDKPFVKSCWEGLPPYNTGKTSVTTPSASKTFESHQTVVYDGNKTKTVDIISRTKPCTYSSKMSVHKSDRIVLVLKARNERKTIAIVVKVARKTKHRLSLHFLHKSHNKKDKSLTALIVTQDDEGNSTINVTLHINNKHDTMRFDFVNDSYWCVTVDDEDLIETTDSTGLFAETKTELVVSKKDFDIMLGISPSPPKLPDPRNILLQVDSLEEEEKKTSFLFENARAFLDQIGKPEENKFFAETVDTKACTEDLYTNPTEGHSTTHPGANNGGDLEEEVQVKEDTEEDDCSSIASSSSSAIYETFEDVSILTDENSLIGMELDEFNTDIETFQDFSLLTEEVLPTDYDASLSSGWQEFDWGEAYVERQDADNTGWQGSNGGWQGAESDSEEETHDEEEYCRLFMEWYVTFGAKFYEIFDVEQEEESLSPCFLSSDFLSGELRCEEGFAQSDELRLA